MKNTKNRGPNPFHFLVVSILILTCSCRRDSEHVGDLLLAKIKSSDHQSLLKLINDGANVNSRGEFGAIPLHKAVVAQDEMSIRLLIDAGALIHARDAHGATAIIQAARIGGELKCARILIAEGANPKDVDDRGSGLVYWAVFPGSKRDLEEVAQWLNFALEHGNNLNHVDNLGRTVLDWSILHGESENSLLIKSLGGITGEDLRKEETSRDGPRNGTGKGSARNGTNLRPFER
jgi:ankyrin repeat protein